MSHPTPHASRRPTTLITSRLGACLISLWLLAASAPPLTAQGGPGSAAGSGTGADVEDTVTVTAQRVEQALQDVPISIVTYDGKDLQDRRIDDLQELALATPGLDMTGQQSSNGEGSISIRGIGSNTFGLGTESTVGYYVDGIYMPRPQTFVNQFLDLERVEVLRGPQGTLWGRNSTGGALNVLTKAPTRELDGRITASYGEYDSSDSAHQSQFTLAVGGAVNEQIWARLSGSWTQNDDPTFNELIGSTIEGFDGLGLRLGLTFLPSDVLSVTVRADVTDDDAHNNYSLRPGGITPASTLGTLQRFFELPALSDDVFRIAANVAPVSQYEENGVSVDLNWLLASGANLQSLTSWRDYATLRRADIDGTALNFVENFSDIAGEWWSQEFKLNGSTARTDWIAGLYAFHEEGLANIDTRTDLALFEVDFFANNPGLFLFDPSNFCSLGFLAPSFLCGIDYYSAIAPFIGLSLPGNLSQGNFFVTDLDSDSYAAYGQVYWQLSDRLTATAGMRYTDDEKTHVQTAIDFVTQAPFTERQNDSWSAFTPKLGLEYRPSASTLVYGSLTTGFKSGGFNSISVQPSYDEETILSTEFGFKTSLLERKLTLNGALFSYQYDDLQVAVLFPDRSSVENAAEATINGLDFDLEARPNDRLTFNLGVSILDDEFDRFESQDPFAVAAAQNVLRAQGILDPVQLALAAASVPTSDLSGRSLPRAPDYSLSASLQYLFSLGNAGTLSARAQFNATDDIAFDGFSNLVQPGYETLAAQLSYRPQRGSWFVTLYGRNLTNEEIKVNEIFFSLAGSLQVYAPPQSVGLQVGFDF